MRPHATPFLSTQALYVPECLPAESGQPAKLTDTQIELLLLLQQQELAQQQEQPAPASPPDHLLQEMPAAADGLTTAEQVLDAEISHLLMLKQLRLLLRTKQQLKQLASGLGSNSGSTTAVSAITGVGPATGNGLAQAMPAVQAQDLMAQLTAMPVLQSKLQK